MRFCSKKFVGSDYFVERWSLLKVLLKIEAQVLTFLVTEVLCSFLLNLIKFSI